MKRGATKEEIIRITQALIARNGIRAVRVDEIAQTLGISKRTLYEMFADKDDLINACLDAMSSKQRERIATYRNNAAAAPCRGLSSWHTNISPTSTWSKAVSCRTCAIK